MKITDKTKKESQSLVFKQGDVVRAIKTDAKEVKYYLIVPCDLGKTIAVNLEETTYFDEAQNSTEVYDFSLCLYCDEYTFEKVEAELIITNA